MPGFEVTTESLRTAGNGLTQAGTSFGDTVASFEASLDGYAAPWGSGMIASILGPAYEQLSAYIFDCLYVAADEMEIGGEDITAMADAYDTADDDAAGQFRSILGQLG